MTLVFDIGLLFVLLALSCFFSGSESALISLSKTQIKTLKKTKSKASKALTKLYADEKRMLITILIGNNVVNIWASAHATVVATAIFQSNAIGIVVGVMTVLILIFGEIIPKSISVANNENISLRVARPLRLFQMLIFPAVWALDLVNDSFFRALKIQKSSDRVTQEEIRTLLDLGKSSGAINKQESRIMREVLHFNNTTVGEVLTPETEMFTLHADENLGDIKKLIVQEAHSRIPIYTSNPPEYTGILHISDVMKRMASGRTNVKLKNLDLQPLFYIPESKKIGELLHDFQNKRTHMALVVDEYGNVQGLVTLEDVLEELVGDILDETDTEEEYVEQLSKKEYLVDARATITFLNDKFGSRVDPGDINTLNGYILQQLGRVPRKGAEISFGNKKVIIVKSTKTQVQKVKLILP